jgi:PAS domain S-box-containing protein
MQIPDLVLIDGRGSQIDRCIRLFESAGMHTAMLGSEYPYGVPLARGLAPGALWTAADTAAARGPLIGVVDPDDLEHETVAQASGLAHSYCIFSDDPKTIRATLVSATRRWHTDRRLAESEEKFRFLAENAGDVIWTYNLRSRRLDFVSPSVKRLRGVDRQTALSETMDKVMVPASYAKAKAQLDQALVEFRHTGQLAPFTDLYEQYKSDGSVIIVEITTTLILDPEGQPEKLLGVSRDATERVAADRALKSALEERETLLKELGHRIKNTLAMTSSFLSLAKDRVKDPLDAALFEDAQSRVQAMVTLYEHLLHSKDHSHIELATYLRELCESIVDAYADEGEAAIKVEGREVLTNSKLAVSVGLAVNEALTNALKYARRPDRVLRVTVVLETGASPDSLRVTVRDDGIGLPSGFDAGSADGLGFLIMRSLAQQLNGNLSVLVPPGGGTEVRFDLALG